MTFDLNGKKIWVAGHRGLVGSALTLALADRGVEVVTATREELDLRDQRATAEFMAEANVDGVVIAAGVVGGIKANTENPASFLYDNLAIAANIIHSAHDTGVAKLLFLGSSCMYPRLADQPVSEDSLLTGPLEPTNEWYAIAKISGLKLCQAYRREFGSDFIVAVPANLYGPGDNFDKETGHVVSALMGRLHDAKVSNIRSVEVWGSGTPVRDFFFVDDCADGLIHLLQTYSDEAPINLGTGIEVNIRALAEEISQVVGFQGNLVFDTSKPDGMPKKILHVSRVNGTGWSATTPLTDGLNATYEWYLRTIANSGSAAG
jgi:GDP-L-fucose synthase